MTNYLGLGLRVDVAEAATSVLSAAVNEASLQADKLMGGAPVPGSLEWHSMYETSAGAERDLATHIVQLRIELAADQDPIGTVIALRRFGATWALIAQAAGSSRQAAHERWGQRVLKVLDRYGKGELGGPVANDESDLV